MKSTSLKSIATLLGVGVVLNLSVLAGPGPQSEPQARKGSDGKTVVTEKNSRASFTVKSVKQESPKVIQITGPHGSTFAYAR
jgi:hypothetical protein